MSEVLLDMYQYYIYDLPLYNNYENVYDTDFATLALYDGTERIPSAVATEISNHLIKTGIVKNGLINFDKHSTITIEFDSIDDIYRAKYIMLIASNTSETTSKVFYYFITDRNIQVGTRVATLYLDRDVWQSNLEQLMSNKMQTKISTPIQLKNTDVDFTDTMTAIELTDGISYIGSDKVNITLSTNELYHDEILWIRLLTDDTYPNLPTNVTATTPYSPLQLIYIPYASISLNGEVTHIYSKLTYHFYEAPGLTNTIDITYNSFFSDTENSHIISKEICTSTPFNITYENTESGYPTISGKYSYFVDNEDRYCFMVYSPTFTVNDRLISSERFKLTLEYTDYYSQITNNQIRTQYGDLQMPHSAVVNPAILKYPFYTSAIRIGDKIIEIPPLEQKSVKLERRLSWLDDNFFVINYGVNNIKYPINERRSLVINKDALTEYLRSNSASLISGAAISTIKGITTILTSPTSVGMISGAAQVVDGMVSPVTKIIDLKNSPDTVIQSKDSYFDVGSISYIKRHSYSSNDEETRYYSRLYDEYGIPFREMTYLNAQNHLYYDFYLVENINGIYPNHSEDIEEIKTILTEQGVRVWHPIFKYDTVRVIANIDVTPIISFKFQYYNYDIGIRGTLWVKENKD